MKELLEIIAKNLVDDKDAVKVTEYIKEDDTIVLSLKVADEDMGKVIGKHGKIAKAIRAVVKASMQAEDKKVFIEIV